MPAELLFSLDGAHDVMEHQLNKMREEISGVDADRLLNTNVDDLVTYFAEKFAIHIPQLHDQRKEIEQAEAASGVTITLHVPFTGDANMFRVRPDTFDFNQPHGQLRGNSLTISWTMNGANPQQALSQITQWVASVMKYLDWQRSTFSTYNETCTREARRIIEQRRARLLANRKLIEALDIPLKRRDGQPTTFPAPEVRRKLSLPPASPGKFEPEPRLEEAEYQYILQVLDQMAHVMERSPTMFHGIGEEALRTLFLVTLNGHYEGQATGETFNCQGKTDILIRSGDRNIFIAECKYWGGPATVFGTIDQLLGYLTWRDSKAAILLFNRNKDFSSVLAAIPELVRKHSNFVKDEGQQSQTRFRCVFRHKDDPAKLLRLTVLAFDVPQK